MAGMLTAGGETAEGLKAAETAADIAERIDQEALRTEATERRLPDPVHGWRFCGSRRARRTAGAPVGRTARSADARGGIRVFLADHAARLMDDFAAAHLARGDFGAALEVIDRGRAPASSRSARRDRGSAARGGGDGRARRAARPRHDAGRAGLDRGDAIGQLTLRPGEAVRRCTRRASDAPTSTGCSRIASATCCAIAARCPMIWTRAAGKIFDAVAQRLPRDGQVILLPEERARPRYPWKRRPWPTASG